MRRHLVAAFLAATVVFPLSSPTAVSAQSDFRWRGNTNSSWDPAMHYRPGRHRERRLGRNDRIYRGSDGRYFCRRSDGTTGLVVGAIAGGLIGNAIGGNTLGTLLGAGGGAVVGQSIARGNYRCR